ncbi:MATE family efflux transporter [Sphingomonas radiodurans]|uniref:MATE family efflux transporter n=1 Tax=Sphingomonas radiodurans TaxID=2890321 RepID=UPI001E4ED9F3|nr:MATE family efflux transporter [Sphingomonas radiodurans]WBH17409.1 MATE family efflux transporter [Sphingomonas radiodurans]
MERGGSSIDRGGEARRILALAWPVMLTSLNWTVLHVTDVIVVGLTGVHEVAALSASRAITFIGIVASLSWLSGILVFASRADGAGDLPRTGAVLREGLVFGVTLGAAMAAVLFFGAVPLLRFVGVAEPLVVPGAAVVRVIALSYPFQLALVAASFFLEGISRPRMVAAVNLSIMPLNALLAWMLATGQAGLPAMGAVGAGLATASASCVGGVAMVGAALAVPRARERGLRQWGFAAWRGTLRGAGRIAWFGVVPALAAGLELAGFSILIALSTQIGEAAAHAFQIVFSIHNVTFAIAMGFASAAGVRAGNAVGEGAPRQAGGRVAIAIGATIAALGLVAVTLIVFRASVVALFPAEPPVTLLAAAMLLPWLPFIVFDGVQVVFVYALRSLGDQVAAGLNGIVAFFVVTGGLGWWLIASGYGPMGLVWASGLGMVAAAALNGGRFLVVSHRLRRQS